MDESDHKDADDERREEEKRPAARVASSPSKQPARERSPSPVRPQKDKPAGSIGKLKISSEMRAKLELVTIAHPANRSSSQPPPNAPVGKQEVKKLEDHRRLMLQQQLGGRKWDSVEEVERITRRAVSEDRVTSGSDLIKAVHQRPTPQKQEAEKARRHSEISSTQTRTSFDTPAQRSSSPPTTYYSMM